MKNKIDKPKFNLNLFHLAIFGIFVISLSIRLYGAYSINLTIPEAEFLLSISGIKSNGSVTFLYGLIIRIIQFLGFNSDLGIRIVNVVMGALVTILPALFSKEIGKRTAIIASIFLTFDPFGIANSIVFSGNIATILFLGLLIETIMHDRDYLHHLIVLLLIGHGRGLGYFLFISLMFLVFLFFVNRTIIYKTIKLFKEKAYGKNKITIAGAGIILGLMLAIIFKIPFSNIASDISSLITGWGGNYQTGNYPIVYPFAIISYIPVALIFSMIFLLRKPGEGKIFKGLGALWLALTFAVIAFYPRHLMIDLIWVSIPFWLITSTIISKVFFENDHFQIEDWPFLALLLVTGINLGLNLISFVYRSIWGLDVTNTLLAILLISIFAVVLMLYRAYTSSLSKVLSALVLASIVFSGLLQLSISARTFGSNKKPENEILWNGYFEGQDIVEEIVDDSKNSIKGTSGKLFIFIDEQVKPPVIWALNDEKLFFQISDLLSNRPELVLSGMQTIAINEDSYQGQEFISDSYPLWTWDPIRGFISTDFWNWFFFRNNLQYKEYNSIWINKTIVNNQIKTGAN
jgi:hypothetical protein